MPPFAEVVALSNQYLREARLHLLHTFSGKSDAALELVEHRAAIAKTAQGMPSEKRDLAMNHATVRLQQLTYVPSVDTEAALECLIEAARRHGADSEPDHEVGDLQDLLREVWKRLSPLQRSLLLASPAASQVFEGGIGEPLATSAAEIEDWEAVLKHFGLDSSFQYTAEAMLEYTNMYRLRDLDKPVHRYVHGGWEHIFRDDAFLPGARSSYLRFVFDRVGKAIVAMQVQHRGEWVDAKAGAIADVQDSLLTANEHALEKPADWGLESSDELPEWAAQPERRTERERACQ